MSYQLSTIPEAIADFRDGRFVIVVDDEDRENEGDLICAAEKITPEEAHAAICNTISGATYKDEQIKKAMQDALRNDGYVCDPHGACGYQALVDGLKPGEVGIFLETAHPAKFKDTVEPIIGQSVAIPATLQKFMQGTKQSLPMSKEFADFKKFLKENL